MPAENEIRNNSTENFVDHHFFFFHINGYKLKGRFELELRGYNYNNIRSNKWISSEATE